METLMEELLAQPIETVASESRKSCKRCSEPFDPPKGTARKICDRCRGISASVVAVVEKKAPKPRKAQPGSLLVGIGVPGTPKYREAHKLYKQQVRAAEAASEAGIARRKAKADIKIAKVEAAKVAKAEAVGRAVKPCKRCQESFAPATGNQKFCDTCRAVRAEEKAIPKPRTDWTRSSKEGSLLAHSGPPGSPEHRKAHRLHKQKERADQHELLGDLAARIKARADIKVAKLAAELARHSASEERARIEAARLETNRQLSLKRAEAAQAKSVVDLAKAEASVVIKQRMISKAEHLCSVCKTSLTTVDGYYFKWCPEHLPSRLAQG